MKRLILAMMAAAALGWGQTPGEAPYGDPQDSGDAPDRGVARISLMNGNVSVRRGDSAELVAAALNAPLMATDRLVTGEGSRAEVQFDWANMIRLAPETEVRFSELQYHRYQIQVATGLITFRVLRDSDAQVEISTPNVSMRPRMKGVYRILVRPDGDSEITVRSGEAEIFGPRGSERLTPGRTMLARGTPSDPEYQMAGMIPQDEWDGWNAGRDRELERTSSYRYVSPDVYGAEDLDRYGRWQNDAQYGNVWVPSVPQGWAPYQQGRWVWMDYYGWTWVSDDPWGWAPYHYGRWYQSGFGWAWYPGPVFERHYWRPALVGFFGWGSPGFGSSFGFGFANVGWCPLAPFEVYRPWYGRGFYGGGYRGVNIINNTNITNVYRNARVYNGITGMRAGEFGRAGINNNNLVRASAGDLSRAGMVRGQMPITPSRESTQFSNRAPSTQGLPRTSDNARFFSTRQPSQVNRVPFEQQRQGVGNGAIANGAIANGPGAGGGSRRAESPAAANPGFAGGANSGPNNGGWQRFNPSNRGAVQGGGAQGGGPSEQPGIDRFNRGGAQGGRRAEQPSFDGFNRGTVQGGSRPEQPAFDGFYRGRSQAQPSQPEIQQPRPAVPSYAPPSGGFNEPRGRFNAPRSEDFGGGPRNYAGPQNPVRISPPIVSNRSGSEGGGGGGSYMAPRGGFGGPRSGGGGGGSFSAPRERGGGGGEFRGNGGGGHGRR